MANITHAHGSVKMTLREIVTYVSFSIQIFVTEGEIIFECVHLIF